MTVGYTPVSIPLSVCRSQFLFRRVTHSLAVAHPYGMEQNSPLGLYRAKHTKTRIQDVYMASLLFESVPK